MLARKGRTSRRSKHSAGGESEENEAPSRSRESSGGGGNEIDNFAKEVLSALSSDSLPPLPHYYSLYFEKLLDDMPMEFQKSMSDLMEGESNTEDEKRMKIEQQLQQGFSFSKEILQNVAIFYKNLNTMAEVSKRRFNEADSINNPAAIKNLSNALSKDLEKLMMILNKQSGNIKALYNKSAKIIKEVEGETIYDPIYNIFNKRYLIDQVRSELKQMVKFSHESSLIVAALRTSVVNKISDKQLVMINRTISKLLLKTSRRSDVVAFVGNGVFSMLLKHTDQTNAVRASERLADLMGQSHFFMGDEEISLDITIGISILNIEKEAEQVIAEGLDAQESADKDGHLVYQVYGNDEPKGDL
jgi:diguanylate cyclase (GGDEF)-like protein